MRTLRTRLILSHILPLLIVVLLIGVSLDYVLETRILLTNLAGELTGEAVLVAGLATSNPELWTHPEQAQEFLDQLAPNLVPQVMLLDLEGRLLASTGPADNEQLGQAMDTPGLDGALAGEVQVHTEYSLHMQANVVDVLVPAWNREHQVVGAVRLTHQLANVYQRFLTLRYLVTGVLAAGLLLGTMMAWLLALNLGRPLQQVTQAVHQLASGQRMAPLAERGPDEIRLLAHAVNRLVEQLRRLEKTRQLLLANLVHELGRPLGAILSAVQALQGGADRDEVLGQEILGGIEQEIGRLRRLLDDLTRLHDRALGNLEIEQQPVVLADWLMNLLIPWRKAAEAKGLDCQVTLADDLPEVELDPDRMAQAVGNLFSNAIKFTPRGGTISLVTGANDDVVWISVTDTGPGIAPEEQTRIFTPFYRGRTDRRFPQGMGLGLSIARDLVLAHRGQLEVTSAAGVGSRFTITLSLKPEQTYPLDTPLDYRDHTP